MYKKRALVLCGYLSLLALAACWPKVIDDSDLVSIDYKYAFSDWTIIEQWSKDFTVWNAGDLLWIENLVRWAKQDDEFNWKINWKDLYKSEYNSNLVQSYPNIILTEVMWVSDPKVWTEVDVNSIWHGVIIDIEKDSDWYNSYVVEFNDPKTYSELSYSIKVTNIEKN
jgi:FKBP-type peptidyl-prolyl cis-trans isomerase 2